MFGLEEEKQIGESFFPTESKLLVLLCQDETVVTTFRAKSFKADKL